MHWPNAVPIGHGRYRVRKSHGVSEEDMDEVIGEGDAHEAIAILVTNLPSHYGPAVDGTAGDLNESYPSVESILKDTG